MRSILATAVLASAAFAQGRESPLLGKPLPELQLSHPLQGAAWTQDELKGCVVVLDVFQLG